MGPPSLTIGTYDFLRNELYVLIFPRFQCVQCFSKTLLIVSKIPSVSCQTLSTIQGSQLFVTKLRICISVNFKCQNEHSKFRPKINVSNCKNCFFLLKLTKQMDKLAGKRIFTGMWNQCNETKMLPTLFT